MKQNHVKKKLLENKTAIGTMVFESNTPGIASILETTGAEFALYDMEHTGIGIESVRQLMSYNRGLDIVPLVRVPALTYAYMARVLDVGAMGLMIPFVETKEQAEEVIAATKYSPLGKRGAVFGVAHDHFTSGSITQKMQSENDETLIIIQIETEKAVENAEEIISTEGVDVAFVGNLDLAQSMGVPGETQHPRVIEAMEKVAKICEKYGKAAGCIVPNADAAVHWKEKGYRFISLSGDIWLLQRALKQGIQAVKEKI